MALKRKQIYLDRNSDDLLKKWSALKGVSEASLIREAVRGYLVKLEEQQATRAAEENPLLRLVGLYQGAIPPDLAVDHDRYPDREEREP